jgi:hypothetical protein
MKDGSVAMTGDFNAGGNSILGNTSASANLKLESTSNATKGYVLLQPNGGNVGIGTTNPTYSSANNILDIFMTDKSGYLRLENTDSSTARWPAMIVANHMGTANAGFPILSLQNNRGTLNTPAALQTNDALGEIEFAGHDGVGSDKTGANIIAYATQTWSGSARGTQLMFQTTPNNSTTYQPRMLIDQNGYVGIGTVSPTAPLEVSGWAEIGGIVIGSSGVTQGAWGSDLALQVTSAGGTDSYLKMLASNGNVGIGTTNPGYKLAVVGDVSATGCLRSSAGVASGTCASDERLKTDVQPFDLGLEALLGIRPHFFKYNGLGGVPSSEKPELGVIAQEVERTAPQLIVTKEVKLNPEDVQTTEIKQVNYTAFTYVLINAVKDLYHRWFNDSQAIHRELASKDQRIQKLEQENEAKTKELEALKAYLCSKDPQATICK